MRLWLSLSPRFDIFTSSVPKIRLISALLSTISVLSCCCRSALCSVLHTARLSPDCPVGTGELPLLVNRLTLAQGSTGDQIVGQIDSAVTCVDPDTGTFTMSGSARITGGTGQFAGATGNFDLDLTGAALASSGNRVFIRLSGPFKGTITTTP